MSLSMKTNKPSAVVIFYGEQIYDQYQSISDTTPMHELPDGVYIYLVSPNEWYLKDLTPVLLTDVPKAYLTMLLLFI